MSRTVTALFDNHQDAEAGKRRLCDADIEIDNIDIVDESRISDPSGSSRPEEDRGMWASIKNAFLPDDDRSTYEEGVRRGGFLLTADVDENQIDDAITALEDTNAVDVEERSRTWRQEGWKPVPAPIGMRQPPQRADRGGSGDQTIPIMEEQLVVGKREVDRGGTRIRSYVTEKPVHEQISLRDETVSVERHKVDKPVSDVDRDPFRERTIEMTETDEEAVVGKKARVVEEVSLKKTSEDRTDQIDETVRHTEVDVERMSDKDRQRSGDPAYGDDRERGLGDTVKGVANEGVGNTKQGVAGVSGSENLDRSGKAQERKGEQQQGKGPDKSY